MALLLPDSTFEGCINSVTLHRESTKIPFGARAFFNCKAFLDTKTLEADVYDIGSSAFEGEGVSKVDLSKCQLSSLADKVVKDSLTLEECLLRAGMTSLSASVFEGCASSVTFTIPPTVLGIGIGCFTSCEKLETVTYLGDIEVTNLLSENFPVQREVVVKEDYLYD